MKIYVAMICKNEQHDIGKCLAAILPEVDKVYIGDTGSTDNTLAVIKSTAESLGRLDDVFLSNINDIKYGVDNGVMWDFSKAKNSMLSLIYSVAQPDDFVFVLDADDIYRKQEKSLKTLVEEANADQLSVSVGGLFTSYRIWKVKTKLFYSGAVHEAVDLLQNPKRSSITIDHIYQSNPALENQEPSLIRNLRILSKVYEEGDHSNRTLFYLADTYKSLGKKGDAAFFFNKYLSNPTTFHDEKMCAYQGLLMVLTSLEAKEDICKRAIVEDPRWSDFWYELALIYYNRRDFEKSFRLCNEAVREVVATPMWTDKDAYFEKPIRLKALIYDSLGLYDSALKELEKLVPLGKQEIYDLLDSINFNKSRTIYIVDQGDASAEETVKACKELLRTQSTADVYLHILDNVDYRSFEPVARLSFMKYECLDQNKKWAMTQKSKVVKFENKTFLELLNTLTSAPLSS